MTGFLVAVCGLAVVVTTMLDGRAGLTDGVGFVTAVATVTSGFLVVASDTLFAAGVLHFLTERSPFLRGLDCLAAGVLAFRGVASFVAGVLGFTGVLDFRGVFVAGGVFSLSCALRTDCNLALVVRGVLVDGAFGVDGLVLIRTERRLVLMGDSGDSISSAGNNGNPAVSCSMLSSRESSASKDSSNLVDETLLKGVKARKLSVGVCECSDCSVIDKPSLEGDRLLIDCTKESSVDVAGLSSGMCIAGSNLGVFEIDCCVLSSSSKSSSIAGPGSDISS